MALVAGAEALEVSRYAARAADSASGYRPATFDDLPATSSVHPLTSSPIDVVDLREKLRPVHHTGGARDPEMTRDDFEEHTARYGAQGGATRRGSRERACRAGRGAKPPQVANERNE
jgi:hypothetical protein